MGSAMGWFGETAAMCAGVIAALITNTCAPTGCWLQSKIRAPLLATSACSIMNLCTGGSSVSQRKNATKMPTTTTKSRGPEMQNNGKAFA